MIESLVVFRQSKVQKDIIERARHKNLAFFIALKQNYVKIILVLRYQRRLTVRLQFWKVSNGNISYI